MSSLKKTAILWLSWQRKISIMIITTSHWERRITLPHNLKRWWTMMKIKGKENQGKKWDLIKVSLNKYLTTEVKWKKVVFDQFKEVHRSENLHKIFIWEQSVLLNLLQQCISKHNLQDNLMLTNNNKNCKAMIEHL